LCNGSITHHHEAPNECNDQFSHNYILVIKTSNIIGEIEII